MRLAEPRLQRKGKAGNLSIIGLLHSAVGSFVMERFQRGAPSSHHGPVRAGRRLLSQGPLLILWHSRTGASRALAEAAAGGTRDAARLLAVEAASPQDLLCAGAYLFVGPENLGALSGAMKELLDRCYYPLLGRVEGRSYATIIAAGSDGSGAQAQLDRIVTGWRLRRVAEPMIVRIDAQTPRAILAEKQVPKQVLAKAAELGETMALGLEQGIF